ncbi:chitinase [Clostridium acetobutylicum]|nr:chitinase [Clostridium acetobutylicum]
MSTRKKLLTFLAVMLVIIFNGTLAFAKPLTKTTAKTAPPAPTGLTATSVTSSDVSLSWQTVSGASGYRIYRAISSDSNYSLLATVSTNTYKNTSLSSGTKYWYFVKAYNSYGISADSTHISVTTTALTTQPASKKLVLGFTTYYYSGDTSSYNSIAANTSTIDEIATHTYTTDGIGNISGLVPTNQVTYANNNGIKTLATIENNFDGAVAQTLLESSTNRQNLINNILTSLKANGYKGVNIDLEGVYYYDRSYLTTFMNELYSTLNPQGFYVTICVPAKTSDSPTAAWNGAFDYAALSKAADQVILMTYDEHYGGGSPGPIASIGWVENVIKYAITVIPTTKIMLGAAAYGYDWSSNPTKAYGISGIYNLASTYNATINWDLTSQSPYFYYVDSSGINHSVWFENGQSLNYKLDLINSYNLSGVAIWRLGLENSDYWTSIRTKFNR